MRNRQFRLLLPEKFFKKSENWWRSFFSRTYLKEKKQPIVRVPAWSIWHGMPCVYYICTEYISSTIANNEETIYIIVVVGLFGLSLHKPTTYYTLKIASSLFIMFTNLTSRGSQNRSTYFLRKKTFVKVMRTRSAHFHLHDVKIIFSKKLLDVSILNLTNVFIRVYVFIKKNYSGTWKTKKTWKHSIILNTEIF